ncbi:MAG: prenyltransferase [Chloroflexaceae bacterium]
MSQNNQQTDLWRGFWRLADPKITLASMAAIFLGTCTAAARGPLDWGWLAVTVFAYFCIEAAKNASGDVFDYVTDQRVPEEDRTPFSGGKRVMVEGILTRNQTIAIAVVLYLLAFVAGAAIVFLREPAVFWLGLVGAFLAFFYNAPPFRLAYHGLGEIACAISYGPLITVSTYMIQRQSLSWEVVLLALPLGLLIANFLWVNEFPDYEADRATGKKNMVVRLGRRRAGRVYVAIHAAAILILLLLPLTDLPLTVWLAVPAVGPGLYAMRYLLANPEQAYKVAPVQPMTLVSFLLFALGGGIGLLLG